MNYNTFIGLDVHKNSISVAVTHNSSPEVDFLGVIPNSPEAISKLLKRFSSKKVLFCYEAGPCGYGIYHQITASGASCFVIAPSLVPTKPGDRIKTDKRDCLKLARLLKNGDLTPLGYPRNSRKLYVISYGPDKMLSKIIRANGSN